MPCKADIRMAISATQMVELVSSNARVGICTLHFGLLLHSFALWLTFFFFFGIYKTKRYIDTLGVHSWEPPGTSRYAQHQR